MNGYLKDEMKGIIINISSSPAIGRHLRGVAHTSAKAAVVVLMKHIAMEYGRNNIRAYIILSRENIATETTSNCMIQEEGNGQ
ncbi:MAG: SDR family oxidoreductase [Thermoproteota archaeon]|nr:SDR family oxidoreductase [Thermoproteota archaeon]